MGAPSVRVPAVKSYHLQKWVIVRYECLICPYLSPLLGGALAIHVPEVTNYHSQKYMIFNIQNFKSSHRLGGGRASFPRDRLEELAIRLLDEVEKLITKSSHDSGKKTRNDPFRGFYFLNPIP